MAHLLKKRAADGSYRFQYVQVPGQNPKTVKGYRDKRATLTLAVQYEEKARAAWLGGVPPQCERLAAESAKSIAQHIEEYRVCLEAQNLLARERRARLSRLERTLKGAGVASLGDLRESVVLPEIGRLREAGKSHETCRKHWKAVKQFSRWVRRDGRIAEDLLAGVELRGYDPKLDPRRPRRALSEEEIGKLVGHLLAAGESVTVKRGRKCVIRFVPAMERLMFLLTVWGAGVRGVECRKLMRESFCLESNPPMLVVNAQHSKHRKRDEVPMTPDIAAKVRPWLEQQPLREPLFVHCWKPAEWLRADLEAAGVPWQDEYGQFNDMHAQRHTFVSRLARSGVASEVTRKLSRHSSDELVQRYTHIDRQDERAAMAKLPPILDASAERALNARLLGGHAASQDGTTPLGDTDMQIDHKPLGNAVMGAIGHNPSQTHPAGLEPATYGSVGRRSIQLS